jgi:hypothetical protein
MPKTYAAQAPFSDKPYVEIPMALVQSSQIACIGYDDARKTLSVQFCRGPGHIYHYPAVDRETFNKFMAADSKGSFFREHIKPLTFDKFQAPAGNGDHVPEAA